MAKVIRHQKPGRICFDAVTRNDWFVHKRRLYVCVDRLKANDAGICEAIVYDASTMKAATFLPSAAVTLVDVTITWREKRG